MIEEEAKSKWCPFARWKFSTLSGSPASNREGGPADDGSADNVWLHKGTRCLGSACMAWRGSETAAFVRRAETEFRRSGRTLKPAGDDIDGYCGLAGAPQP